jgi:hypothetical protein
MKSVFICFAEVDNARRIGWKYLVHIAKNLPPNVFATSLFVVKNTGGSRLKHAESAL